LKFCVIFPLLRSVVFNFPSLMACWTYIRYSVAPLSHCPSLQFPQENTQQPWTDLDTPSSLHTQLSAGLPLICCPWLLTQHILHIWTLSPPPGTYHGDMAFVIAITVQLLCCFKFYENTNWHLVALTTPILRTYFPKMHLTKIWPEEKMNIFWKPITTQNLWPYIMWH
jgi:hypothetical protein